MGRTEMPHPRFTSIQQLAAMLQDVNVHVKTFASLREKSTSNAVSSDLRFLIHEHRCPLTEHIRSYDGSSSSKVAAIIPRAEDGIVERGDIVLCRSASLNSAENKVLDKISTTQHPYNLLSYVLLLPFGENVCHIPPESLHYANSSQRIANRTFKRATLTVSYCCRP